MLHRCITFIPRENRILTAAGGQLPKQATVIPPASPAIDNQKIDKNMEKSKNQAANITVRPIGAGEEPPYGLLLDADPSRDLVEGYLGHGTCLLALAGAEVVGVCVVTRAGTLAAEIANLAVGAPWRRQGIGTRLVRAAAAEARTIQCREIMVCTGNSDFGPMRLYARCGFRTAAVDRDYFRRHYPEPIFENGAECRHRIIMRMALRPETGLWAGITTRGGAVR